MKGLVIHKFHHLYDTLNQNHPIMDSLTSSQSASWWVEFEWFAPGLGDYDLALAEGQTIKSVLFR